MKKKLFLFSIILIILFGIFNFVLNVAPLFNNGYALETPDTINMISAYLQNKVITDFQGRGIFGYLVQGMEFVVRTCSRTDVDESGVEFNPALISDPEDQIKYTGKRAGEKLYEELLISAESEKTLHPLIYKARENYINSEILLKELQELKKYLKNFDYDSTFEVLKNLVPEWENP